jgi:hypothetical protein
MVTPIVFMAEPMLRESASNQPASLKGGLELLLQAEKHKVGEVGWFVVTFLGPGDPEASRESAVSDNNSLEQTYAS